VLFGDEVDERHGAVERFDVRSFCGSSFIFFFVFVVNFRVIGVGEYAAVYVEMDDMVEAFFVLEVVFEIGEGRRSE